MKISRLTIFIFCMSFFIKLHAQTTRFGIKVEPQTSWFTVIGDNSSATTSGWGFNFGLMADKYFAENYAVELGISLSGVKSGLEFTDSTSWKLNSKDKLVAPEEEVELRIQYIDIPLGLKFKSKSIGYVQIYAHIGADAMIRAKALADVPTENIENNDAKEEISLINFGYHIGGGVEYSLGGNTSLVAGLHYTNGLVDLTSNKDDNVSVGILAFRIGIMF